MEPDIRPPRAYVPLFKNILFFASLLITVGLVIWVWATAVTLRDLLTRLALVFALIGFYPVSYLAYLGFGGDIAQRQRLRDDFRLLGLVSEEELDETVEKLYYTVYGRGQFMAYIALIMLVSLLILAGYRFRTQLDFIAPDTLLFMFYAYLGAYVFSVQAIARRYNTFDLQPQVYTSALVRMLVALALTFVGASVIGLSGAQIAGGDIGAGEGAAWAAVLAFVIGAFPDSGLRWFLNQSSRVLASPADQSSDRPLRNIIGISAWHEARLAEMGIDDAQNLATVDIRKLLLTTKFDVQEIINWIDQAILYTKVGDKVLRFRDSKISTFYEFRQVYSQLLPPPAEQMVDERAAAQTQNRERLAAILGLSGVDELDRLADEANFPNYVYIAEYYSRTATVARQRADRGMSILLGALLETDFKRAAAELKRRLAHNPKDARLWNNLGYAYYKLRDLDNAFKAYSKAIALDVQLANAYLNRSVIYCEKGEYEKAMSDSARAISIDSTQAEAFNNRGLAYMKMGYLDQAIIDFNEALRLNDRLARAYYNRGFTYSEQGNFDSAVDDFERAYLLGYRDDALLWFRWGESLLKLGKFHEAITKLSGAILQDGKLNIAYVRRGYAYLELGEMFYTQARSDFKKVIGGAPTGDESLPVAYTNLGILEARSQKYQAAVDHYQKALEIDEHLFVARYNLAVAYHNLNRLDEARAEFQTLIQSAPGTSFARQASEWLQHLDAPAAGTDEVITGSVEASGNGREAVEPNAQGESANAGTKAET